MPKVVINVAGGLVQDVHADTEDITVILVDFDNEDDSEEISALYVKEVLENPNMFIINLQSLLEDIYYAECGVCEREEAIRLNETNWMPSVFLDESGEIGPVCPECQQRWVRNDNDGHPVILSSDITLDKIHLVPNLLKTIQGINAAKAKSDAVKPLETPTPDTFVEPIVEPSDPRVEWLWKFFNNMVKTLIDCKFFADEEEAASCLEFTDELHGRGPAILKVAGTFEILGNDICIDLDRNKYVTVESPDDNYFAEPENAECIRCYKS